MLSLGPKLVATIQGLVAVSHSAGSPVKMQSSSFSATTVMAMLFSVLRMD